jgi:hypothetical protein
VAFQARRRDGATLLGGVVKRWRRDDRARRQAVAAAWRAVDERAATRCTFDSAHTGEHRHTAHRDLTIPIRQDHDGRHLAIGRD